MRSLQKSTYLKLPHKNQVMMLKQERRYGPSSSAYTIKGPPTAYNGNCSMFIAVTVKSILHISDLKSNTLEFDHQSVGGLSHTRQQDRRVPKVTTVGSKLRTVNGKGRSHRLQYGKFVRLTLNHPRMAGYELNIQLGQGQN